MKTLIVSPVAGANSPVDGSVFRQSVNEIFATIRAGAGFGSEEAYTAANPGVKLVSTATTNQYQILHRGIFCFDTSSLPDSAQIISAVISFYGADSNPKSNALGTTDLYIASANPDLTSALNDTDYSHCGSISFGSIAYADFTGSQYNNISLNALGIANINKTGISKFSTQLGWDLLNDTTGLNWVGLGTTEYRHNWADDGANPPKLTITYTIPGMLGLLL